MSNNHMFIFNDPDSIASILFAGRADTSSPRLHAKDSGFLFEYILSGEECIESPDYLIRAGIGELVVIHPSEECVLYRSGEDVVAYSLFISGFVLEAAYEVLGIPRVKTLSADVLDRFIDISPIFEKYVAGDASAGRYLLELAFSLLLDAASPSEDNFLKPSAERIKDYLNLYICGDVDLDSVGKRFGITGMHVIRLFRQKYNITPMQYLKNKRLEKSADLLIGSHLSIKEISSLLRFSSTQHFTNLFREYFGMTPGKYRELNT